MTMLSLPMIRLPLLSKPSVRTPIGPSKLVLALPSMMSVPVLPWPERSLVLLVIQLVVLPSSGQRLRVRAGSSPNGRDRSRAR